MSINFIIKLMLKIIYLSWSWWLLLCAAYPACTEKKMTVFWITAFKMTQ